VLGLSLAEKSVDCRTFSPEKPVILVVGNEGFGLRKMVEDSCTKLLKIPSQSQSQNKNLDSLNVATALGIVLYQISKTSIS
jgi:tRNA G18 (ribose-2'-O)-methylase SpoU